MVANHENRGATRPKTRISRRGVLAAAAGGGAVTLAGCTGDGGDGGGGDGGDGGDGGGGSGSGGGGGGSGTVDTVKIGSTVPLSGPYGVAGKAIRNLLELAGQQAVEAGEIGDFELMITDSKSDPATARKVTRQQLDDGADFFVTALQSTTINAVARLLEREDVVFMSTPGFPRYDTDVCIPNFFKFTRVMPGWIQNTLGYTVEEGLGSSVYTIHNDVLQMNEMLNYTENTYAPEQDVDLRGSTAVPFGTTDFSQSLTQARESGADIVNFYMFGADLLSALSQANEFGFIDEGIVISAPTVDFQLGAAMDAEIRAYENAYFGLVGGYHEIDTPANNEFTDLYRDRYDSYPTFQTWYQGARTLLRAVGETGTKDTDTIREQLKGHEAVPNLFGTGETFRACDNRLSVPSVTMQGRPAAEVSQAEMNFFEVVNINGNVDEIMYPCDRIACQNQ